MTSVTGGDSFIGTALFAKVIEIHPEQKAIIVSGFSETDRVKAAQALGAGVYVLKPYTIEKLGLALREELDRATWSSWLENCHGNIMI